jgi:hypothetical protein
MSYKIFYPRKTRKYRVCYDLITGPQDRYSRHVDIMARSREAARQYVLDRHNRNLEKSGDTTGITITKCEPL